MKSFDTKDMIYALATPPSRSALAVFRASGEGCLNSLAKFFSPASRLLDCPTNTCVYGRLKDIDQVVVNVYRNGHGYTGEEAFELMCHGSQACYTLIPETLEKLGFRQAQGGEFTLRAFLAGRMDLTQSEAVEEIVNSDTSMEQKQAFSKLQGKLFKTIESYKTRLLDILAPIELQLDYAQDDIEDAFEFPQAQIQALIDDMQKLGDTYQTSTLVLEGAKVVLAGPVNAGKSTLFNYMLKTDRAIVSPIQGTTRDYLEAQCLVDGMKIRLFDTAGLRQSSDEIEELGIQRSKMIMEDAQIVIYMSKDISDLESQNPGYILVHSQCDRSLEKSPFIDLSCVTGQGFPELFDAIKARLAKLGGYSNDDLMIQSSRQAQGLRDACLCLTRAIEESPLGLDLSAAHINGALNYLGELVGQTASDDILERIFSSFCVGK